MGEIADKLLQIDIQYHFSRIIFPAEIELLLLAGKIYSLTKLEASKLNIC
jgi:hypothetical protein